jgi:hypothetical protein
MTGQKHSTSGTTELSRFRLSISWILKSRGEDPDEGDVLTLVSLTTYLTLDMGAVRHTYSTQITGQNNLG